MDKCKACLRADNVMLKHEDTEMSVQPNINQIMIICWITEAAHLYEYHCECGYGIKKIQEMKEAS